MSSKPSSEKLALYVALIASIVALGFSSINYQNARSAAVPAPMPGGAPGGGSRGGGMGMRGFAPSPEYIEKYAERVALLRQALADAEVGLKAGAISPEDVYLRRYLLDEARLGLLRLRAGRRASGAFAEALLACKYLAAELKLVEAKPGADAAAAVHDLRLRLNDAELRRLDTARRIEPEAVERAEAIVAKYPDALTDEQLQALLDCEPAPGGGGPR